MLLLLNKNDLEVFLRRAAELALRAPVFASKNAYDALSATKVRGLYHNVCFTYPLEQLRALNAFRSGYEREFKEQPRIYADNTYDALFILHEAHHLRAAQELSLEQALKKVRYTGLLGEYAYHPRASFSRGRASLVCANETLTVE